MNITITIPGLPELAAAVQSYADASREVAKSSKALLDFNNSYVPKTATGIRAVVNGEETPVAEVPTTESTVVGVAETVETPAPAKRTRRTKAEVEAAKAPAASDVGAKNIAAINATLDAMRAAPAAPAEAPEKTDHELREEVRSIYRERSANDPDFKNTYAEKLASVNDGEVVRLDLLPRDKVIALISALS